MSSKWITVARTVWPHEAHMLAGMLRDHDVDAVVADEYMVQMEGFASYALGGVKVKVREQDAERARALLSDVEGGPPANGHAPEE
jgi:hypothetical protein